MQKTLRTTLALSKKDYEQLQYLQDKLGESQSSAVRSAINFYYFHLHNEKKDNK